MAHAVSLSYARSDHMSPVAVAMTTTLHLAVAAALYWISPLRYVETMPETIAITMERELPPPPAETPQPTPTPETPIQAAARPTATLPPTPPMRLGLPPIAPSPSLDPKAAPGIENPEPPKPQTPAVEAAQPEPPPEPAKAVQQQALAAPPPPPPPPSPKLENALPPLEAPLPPLTSQEIPRPAPPPPPAPKLENALPPLEAPLPPPTSQEIPRPAPPPAAPKPPPPTQQRAQPAPAPRPRQQALQSSPLSNLPRDQQASRQAPTLVNPADMHGGKRAEEQYLWYVAQKLSQHQQFVRNVKTEAGTVVLRLTIARDGRLVHVGLSRSSGLPSLDNVTMNMARQASPYPPLPDDLSGPQRTFILPLYFKRN